MKPGTTCGALQRRLLPTAEGHVIVADYVLRHVNEIPEKLSLAQN